MVGLRLITLMGDKLTLFLKPTGRAYLVEHGDV
jgi:hypothetical protein